MPKDYANLSSKRRSPSGKKKSSGFFWFIIVLIAAGFIAALAYLHKHKTQMLHKKLQEPKKTLTAKAPAPATTTPRFEFYGMLSGNQNPPTTESTATQPTTEPVTPAATNTVNPAPKHEAPVITLKPTTTATPAASKGFVLQIASFADNKPAQQLKAKLSMQGVETTILKLSNSGKTWYRVIAGPYQTSTNAEKVQHQLNSLGYKPLLHNQ